MVTIGVSAHALIFASKSDPLADPIEEQHAEAPVPIEELAPMPPEVSMSRLSTASAKKPTKTLASNGRSQSAPLTKNTGKLKLGTSNLGKPNKALQAIGS